MNNRYLSYAFLGAAIICTMTGLHAADNEMVVFKNIGSMFKGAQQTADSAKPMVATAISLVAGVGIGVYQRSFWQAIVTAVLAGSMVYFFPSLFN